jgi:DNA invertase Pin-like site-specific DNA recombinase
MPRKYSHTIGYLRVSTSHQDTEKNQADILVLAHQQDLGKVHFIEEKASGKTPWRQRKIAEVLDMLEKGDRLIVSELSRLGRSMLECMEMLALATQKGIRVYAVKGNWQLDDSMQSKIMALAFAMAAEIEHDLISQRTKEALRARKRAGVKLGRPKGPGKSKLDPYQPEIAALLAHGSTQKYIAQHYRVTEATVSRWLKKRGVKCTLILP